MLFKDSKLWEKIVLFRLMIDDCSASLFHPAGHLWANLWSDVGTCVFCDIAERKISQLGGVSCLSADAQPLINTQISKNTCLEKQHFLGNHRPSTSCNDCNKKLFVFIVNINSLHVLFYIWLVFCKTFLSFVDNKYSDNMKFYFTVYITAPCLVDVCHLLAHKSCHLTGGQHKQVQLVLSYSLQMPLVIQL